MPSVNPASSGFAAKPDGRNGRLACPGSMAHPGAAISGSGLTPPCLAGIRRAKPVYPVGLAEQLNSFVGFRTRVRPIRGTPVTLAITASSVYRLFVDGLFVGYGPARAGHGHHRLDVYDLTPHLRREGSTVAIEVAGYNVNSYYLLDQPAFLLAEVTAGSRVLAATGRAGTRGFEALNLPHRIRKVQRYSFQRPFIEMYRMAPDADAWRSGARVRRRALELETRPAVPLLARGLALPEYAIRQPALRRDSGTLTPAPRSRTLYKDRSLTNIGPALEGFPEGQLPDVLSSIVQAVRIGRRRSVNEPYGPDTLLALRHGTYEMVDFGVNLTGFPGMTVTCSRPARLVARFDEIVVDHDIRQSDMVNAVSWDLSPGTHRLECFEPYVMRYLKLYCARGRCEVRDVYLREYACPDVDRAQFACSDDRLNQLFAAARQTFRQNAVDLYTDCPHRERAGWMDNSYWMAEVELLLTGRSRLERNYLENFLHYDQAHDLPRSPQGMLPMCYPADHDDGNYIPQWPFWFILELEEYLRRTGDRDLVGRLRPRLVALFTEYLDKYRNADGLLEKLGGWRFVEWSHANELQDDVNYPTNMQYAAALLAMARLYGLPAWARQAQRIHAAIRKQSFDGQWFIDNALRKDGRLVPSGECTEVCQYFAFAFGTATPASHSKLWQTLLSQFGPERVARGLHKRVRPANLINGIYLRLKLLTQHGHARQVLRDLPGYFLEMAHTTGTLWEHTNTGASCNHGCSSHVLNWLIQNATGLRMVDPPNRTVHLTEPANDLKWWRLRVPTPDGLIELEHDGRRRATSLPRGWRVHPA